MSQLLVRNLDPQVKDRLRSRARRNGRSMEAEARSILQAALRSEQPPSRRLGDEITAMFKDIGLGPDEGFPPLPDAELRSPFDDDHR